MSKLSQHIIHFCFCWHLYLTKFVTFAYMSTLPDSAGVSRIFKNFLRKSRIDIFSRQERSFPRILRSPPGGKLHLTKLCFTPFPRLVKGSDHRSRLSKHASLTLINDCTICLIVLITSTGLITPMN